MVPNGSLTAVPVQAARVAGWLDHGSRRGPAAQGLQPGNLYRFGPPHGTMLVSFPTKVFGSDTADPSHGDSCSMSGRALVPRTEGGPVGGGGVLRLERRQHVVGACRRPCRQRPVPERPAVASDSTVAVRASTEQKNIKHTSPRCLWYPAYTEPRIRASPGTRSCIWMRNRVHQRWCAAEAPMQPLPPSPRQALRSRTSKPRTARVLASFQRRHPGRRPSL